MRGANVLLLTALPASSGNASRPRPLFGNAAARAERGRTRPSPGTRKVGAQDESWTRADESGTNAPESRTLSVALQRASGALQGEGRPRAELLALRTWLMQY